MSDHGRGRRPARGPAKAAPKAQEVTTAVLRTADLIRRRTAAALAPYGITAQQYNVLRILRGAQPDGLATLEVADRMLEQTPGVTRLLDRLEEAGLVSRERGTDDRRLVHCRITPPGQSLLAELDGPIDAVNRELVRSVDAPGRWTLLRLLALMRERE